MSTEEHIKTRTSSKKISTEQNDMTFWTISVHISLVHQFHDHKIVIMRHKLRN